MKYRYGKQKFSNKIEKKRAIAECYKPTTRTKKTPNRKNLFWGEQKTHETHSKSAIYLSEQKKKKKKKRNEGTDAIYS